MPFSFWKVYHLVGLRLKKNNHDFCGHEIICRQADTFCERLVGLSWQKKIPDKPLLFRNCLSIHTFGMFFLLDLVWLDADYCVIRIDRNICPGAMRSCSDAKHVMEYASCLHFDFQVGNRFVLTEKKRFKKIKNSGQTVVEAAFIFPLLFLVVFGFLQLSLAITEKQKLYHVVHYAVQAGSLSNDNAKIDGAIESYYDARAITVSIQSKDEKTDQIISDTNRRYNDIITVRIDRDFTLSVPFLEVALSEISAEASARVLCNQSTAPYQCD
jgi:uncharacterized membrane protein (UPF0127 family)